MKKETRRGPAPFGFRWRDGGLEVVAGEARTRKLAFEYYVKLGSKGAVARKLNEGGQPTRRNGKWSDMQVARILACSSAIGRYVPGAAAERGSAQDADSKFVVCEPLISLDLWSRVASRLTAQGSVKAPSVPSASKMERLFAGQVFCDCGEQMILPNDDQKYGCPACLRKIGLVELENVLIEDLSELLASDPRFLAAIGGDGENVPIEFELAEAERELSVAIAERSRVERLLIEKVISTKRFGELEKELQASIEAAEKKVDALRKRKSAAVPKADANGDARKSFGTRWRQMTATARNRIARAFVERINVGADAVELTYLFGHSASKDAIVAQQVNAPTSQTVVNVSRDLPVFVRLPKPGGRCAYTGLSRAKLYDLILPCRRNNGNPPVKSKSVRKTGSMRGVRLILLESLMAHVNSGE